MTIEEFNKIRQTAEPLACPDPACAAPMYVIGVDEVVGSFDRETTYVWTLWQCPKCGGKDSKPL